MRPMSRRGDRDGQRRPVAPRRALSQAAPSCRSAIRSRLVLKVPAKEFLSCRDRLALGIGLGNPELALRNDRLSRFAAGRQEIIVSDAGKLLQLRPWIALATTSPLVVGGATVSASPSTIATGVLICARLVGSSACTRAGAIAKTARAYGMEWSSPACATSAATSGGLRAFANSSGVTANSCCGRHTPSSGLAAQN